MDRRIDLRDVVPVAATPVPADAIVDMRSAGEAAGVDLAARKRHLHPKLNNPKSLKS